MLRYISALDTARFGFKVAKINKFSELNDTPENVLEELKKLNVKLVISRVSTTNMATINTMEDLGFRLKDVQNTYNFDLNKDKLPKVKQETCIYRDFKDGDIESISKIASNSFQKYGHYFNNENTKRAGTSAIYEDWARRSCADRNLADHIVVAEYEGTVAGFLSLKIQTTNQERYAAGVMGAVGKDHRKFGVFQGINIASLHWAKMVPLARVEHNVLATNFQVNRTYNSLGFHIIRSEVTLHCWLGADSSI
jgi:L-amino acid N-acyltransferase YncA